MPFLDRTTLLKSCLDASNPLVGWSVFASAAENNSSPSSHGSPAPASSSSESPRPPSDILPKSPSSSLAVWNSGSISSNLSASVQKINRHQSDKGSTIGTPWPTSITMMEVIFQTDGWRPPKTAVAFRGCFRFRGFRNIRSLLDDQQFLRVSLVLESFHKLSLESIAIKLWNLSSSHAVLRDNMTSRPRWAAGHWIESCVCALDLPQYSDSTLKSNRRSSTMHPFPTLVHIVKGFSLSGAHLQRLAVLEHAPIFQLSGACVHSTCLKPSLNPTFWRG